MCKRLIWWVHCNVVMFSFHVTCVTHRNIRFPLFCFLCMSLSALGINLSLFFLSFFLFSLVLLFAVQSDEQDWSEGLRWWMKRRYFVSAESVFYRKYSVLGQRNFMSCLGFTVNLIHFYSFFTFVGCWWPHSFAGVISKSAISMPCFHTPLL